MKKQISILIGSCLAIAAIEGGLAVGNCIAEYNHHTHLSTRISSVGLRGVNSNFDVLPLYRKAHAREIFGSAFDQAEAQSTQNDRWSEGKDIFSDRSYQLVQFINSKVRDLLPKPWRPKTSRIARAIIENANRQHMDPLFLMAVIQHESRFNPLAVGSHGEIGLMQVKPETARVVLGEASDMSEMSDQEVRKILRDPARNVAIGASYLATLRRSFKGRSELYISAYNLGALQVRRIVTSGQQPKKYLGKVLAQYAALTESYSLGDLTISAETMGLLGQQLLSSRMDPNGPASLASNRVGHRIVSRD